VHVDDGSAVGLVFDVDVHEGWMGKMGLDGSWWVRVRTKGAGRLEHFRGFDKWKRTGFPVSI
jgi:hypothetical protein